MIYFFSFILSLFKYIFEVRDIKMRYRLRIRFVLFNIFILITSGSNQVCCAWFLLLFSLYYIFFKYPFHFSFPVSSKPTPLHNYPLSVNFCLCPFAIYYQYHFSLNIDSIRKKETTPQGFFFTYTSLCNMV